MDQVQLDEQMMRRCLLLARTAEGRTSPNPMVGSVVLDKNGEIVGEGFHPKAGMPHAEVYALNQAAEKARGGTLYVNLEPCSHFGKTPPCADRVIASGIKRVVLGLQDPNPKVHGQGIKRLQDAGIETVLSTLESDCSELNKAFVKRISTGMPWLSLKMACTLDGRIADRHGQSRWVSGAEARAYVHELRNLTDCVLIGGKTAELDDPELNVRDIENSRDPHRAVFDPSLRVKPEARLCRHQVNSESWTAIFTSAKNIASAPKYPERVELMDCTDQNGQTDFAAAFKILADKGVQTILCEGGGRLAAALLEEKLVDEIYWIIAPKLLIDKSAQDVLSGAKFVSITNCVELETPEYKQLGLDMLIRGRVRYSK